MRSGVIRGYRPADEPDLYEICLRTGANGGDATGRHADPRLLGQVYVGPYLALAPEFAFVLTSDGGAGDGGDDDGGGDDGGGDDGGGDDGGGGTALGYVLGAPDTAAFEQACERSWWPPLRARYPDPAGVPDAQRTPDQRLATLIHHPHVTPVTVTDRYPAHLHIDLLPAAQGQGHGRALLERLFTALAGAGVTGVHLGVSTSNPKAIGFYRRVGLTEIARYPGALTMAKTL